MGGRRGGIDDVTALPVLWGDFDCYSEGVHKDKNLPHTKNQVEAILQKVGAAATIVTWTGHGLQAFWALSEAFEVTDENRLVACREARGWAERLQEVSKDAGFSYDVGAKDIARVLRMPNTWNRKAEPVKSYFIRSGGPKYDLDVLMALCQPIEGTAQGDPKAKVDTTERSFVLDMNSEINHDLIYQYCQYDDKFETTWLKRRRFKSGRNSASEYDLAIANFGVHTAAMNDQQICNLIVWWRKQHGCLDTLEARKVAIALHKAHNVSQMEPDEELARAEADVEQASRTSKKSSDKAAEDEKKKTAAIAKDDQLKAAAAESESLREGDPLKWLQAHRVFSGVPLVGVRKAGRSNGDFFLLLEDEKEIEIGTTCEVLTHSKVRAAILDGLPGVCIPDTRRKEWARVATAITAVAGEGVDTGASPEQICLEWLRAMIENVSDSMKVAFNIDSPEVKIDAIKHIKTSGWAYIESGNSRRLALRVTALATFISSVSAKIALSELSLRLLNMKFHRERVKQRYQNVTEEVRVWVSCEGFDVDA